LSISRCVLYLSAFLVTVFPATGQSVRAVLRAPTAALPSVQEEENLFSCQPDATTLCLNGGRFRVTASFSASPNLGGAAQAVALTDVTGYLWFFSADNVEIVVKVLDGCGVNGHYWVFVGGLTNVDVCLRVADTQTEGFTNYCNPSGTPFQPVQDTSAFPTCP
jgi:hypothetical protein